MSCTCNAIISKSVLSCVERRVKCIDFTLLYISCSIFNAASLLCTNKSLVYVSYPAQVLGKACRPIPVIILSALIARKYHSIWKWIVVILITTGIVIFIYDEDKNAKHSSERSDIDEKWLYFGDALLFTSLILDGFTSAFQEKIRFKAKEEKAETKFMPLEMMSTLNSWASMIALPFCLFSGL